MTDLETRAAEADRELVALAAFLRGRTWRNTTPSAVADLLTKIADRLRGRAGSA